MFRLGSPTAKGAHQAPSFGRWAAGKAAQAVDQAVLLAHRLACRMDATPAEFGAGGPVDETDGRAVGREWLRCLRLWADYNPEEIFALKVGAGLLTVAILILWTLIAMFR